ncbi:DUF5777 family beta-barrel protein [uncultured Chitinophaga sp.]|jgi:hypothetical protein|uniref:DUF5777 family beta-barrel protein n=1 Tax=uncultured Chitinophaga sp. TaxID=339340 RepID=UPI0026179B4C|nr:DUF5777 family beta-barrel protein [uncultured Chitinophaga sp.]
MKAISLLLISCGLCITSQAQDDLSTMFKDSTGHQPVIGTFKSTRIIMGHSNETLKKHELDFRVAHRFGDAGGSFGGGKTAFGLDNSTDIRIAFEYGITDDLMIGISRAKGSGDLTQIFEGLAKYRILKQTTDDHIPVSLTVFGNVTVSTMSSNDDATSPSHFDEFTDRMTYVGQAILARKFGERLSLTLSPTYVHRNRVGYMDQNNMFALGGSGRVKLSKRLAFIAEYYYPFRSQSSKDYYKSQGVEFFNPLGAGLEIETGGHVFSVNFTNSTAILENQFIPETRSSWLQGQFRWGFNISRRFSLFGKKDWKK